MDNARASLAPCTYTCAAMFRLLQTASALGSYNCSLVITTDYFNIAHNPLSVYLLYTYAPICLLLNSRCFESTANYCGNRLVCFLFQREARS